MSKFIMAVLLLLAVEGCSSTCTDGFRLNGIVIETGPCHLDCCGKGPHDAGSCRCSKDCACWRVR